MNTEQNTMSENENAATDVELRLEQALQALLVSGYRRKLSMALN